MNLVIRQRIACDVPETLYLRYVYKERKSIYIHCNAYFRTFNKVINKLMNCWIKSVYKFKDFTCRSASPGEKEKHFLGGEKVTILMTHVKIKTTKDGSQQRIQI